MHMSALQFLTDVFPGGYGTLEGSRERCLAVRRHFEACMDSLREFSRKEAMRDNVNSTDRDFRIHSIHSTIYRETFPVTVRCRRASDSLIRVVCNGAVQWVEGVSRPW
jgi:hypothetical protein